MAALPDELEEAFPDSRPAGSGRQVESDSPRHHACIQARNGGGLGGLGRGGAGGFGGLSFMTASKVLNSSAAAGRGSEGRRSSTVNGRGHLAEGIRVLPSLLIHPQ